MEINPRICGSTPSAPRGRRAASTPPSRRSDYPYPYGIVVSRQDEKSQLKNKEKAMVCAAGFWPHRAEQEASWPSRRSMVGSGDRSERIRTYNFPQNRVTDHRIGLTLHKLDQVLDGELGEIIEQLAASSRAEQLRQVGS